MLKRIIVQQKLFVESKTIDNFFRRKSSSFVQKHVQKIHQKVKNNPKNHFSQIKPAF